MPPMEITLSQCDYSGLLGHLAWCCFEQGEQQRCPEEGRELLSLISGNIFPCLAVLLGALLPYIQF